MKRILFAVAAGIVFVTGYLFAIALIVVLSGNYGLIRSLGIPLSLPKTVYFYFFPPTGVVFANRVTVEGIILTIMAYVINVLLYSIPFYLLFTIIARRRRKVPATQPPPPLPPSFDS
jgi:hypothetical protein